MKKFLYLSIFFVVYHFGLNSITAQIAALDTIFDIGNGANSNIGELIVLPNDRLIIGGEFATFNNVTADHILRLLPDGAIDTSWAPLTAGGANSSVRGSALQPDGKILLGGIFTLFNGVTANRLVRVDPNGITDPTFLVGAGPNNEIQGINASSNRIVIRGFFSQYQGVPVPSFAVLNYNGTLDTTFAKPLESFISVSDMMLIQNNKLYLVGNFSTYNSQPVNRIVRLHANGSIDTSFNTGTGFNSKVSLMAIQTDNKILLSGSFSTFNGTSVDRLIRLHPNGSLDTTFNSPIISPMLIRSMGLDNQGRVIVAGSNAGYLFVHRLMPDGSLDTTFNVGTGFNGSIDGIDIQSTGKIIFTGAFTQYQNQSSRRIARLLSDTCTGATPPTIYSQVQNINCPGDSTMLYVTVSPNNGSTQWNWYEGGCHGTLIGVGDSIMVAPNSPTTYYVSGGGSCLGVCSQINITIADTIAPVPDISILPDLTDLCEINITQVPTATDNCAGPVTATSQSPMTYTTPGNYTVVWSYDDGNGNLATQNQNVIITGMNSGISLDTLPDLSIELSADHSSTSAQYQWLRCDSNMAPITGAINQEYVPIVTGSYAVVITDSGCTDTSNCLSVTISPLGILSVDLQQVRLFPNPAKGTLHVSLSSVPDEVNIYSITGKLVHRISPKENNISIPLTNLPSGLYLLEVSKNGERSMTKFEIVQ